MHAAIVGGGMMKRLAVAAFIILAVLFFFTTYARSSSVEYVAHVQNIGWMDLARDGQTAGTTGQGLQMEAIKISVKGLPNAHITYQAHVGGPQGPGWQDWMRDGQMAGTTGQGRRIEAVKIRLENAPGWSVAYQVHAAGIGWMGWVKDGEVAGTTGQGRRIEAVAIKLQPAAPDATQTAQTQPGQTTSSQSAPGQADNCVSLNPNTATVANIQGSWKVVDGSRWLFRLRPGQGRRRSLAVPHQDVRDEPVLLRGKSRSSSRTCWSQDARLRRA